MQNILSVKKIEKYYGHKGNITKAIDNISFTVNQGEFVGIMGPSGSGKTTLLNCISTIDTVTTGHIIINNKDITALKTKDLEQFRRDELGFIFQDFNLLDTLTAYENIALALTIQRREITEIDNLIKNVAKKLGIIEILTQYPFQLSGGQKQRVACSSRLLLELFEKLNNEFRSTILMVTHDSFTASYAHRILFIKDGRIFNELIRGNDTRKEFFNKIIEVVTLLGGDVGHVL